MKKGEIKTQKLENPKIRKKFQIQNLKFHEKTFRKQLDGIESK
jgi:hypothetical protein